jgi:hypothetical protein
MSNPRVLAVAMAAVLGSAFLVVAPAIVPARADSPPVDCGWYDNGEEMVYMGTCPSGSTEADRPEMPKPKNPCPQGGAFGNRPFMTAC